VGVHAVAWLFAFVVSTNSFSSLLILISSLILKGSDHVYNNWSHWVSGLWALFGILNTRKNNVSRFIF
jgi:hypothetical protein